MPGRAGAAGRDGVVAATEPGPLLELAGVARTFATTPPVHALRDVSFQVQAGEQVAIVGRSGSGKSTLLNVLGLLDQASSGTYMIGGQDVRHRRERERTLLRSTTIGFVFQQSFLLPRLSAQENVELPLRRRRVSATERRLRALDALERVGLAHRRQALPTTLSGGEAQRAAIARALAQQPGVLLCDEPTGNLDERTSTEVASLIRAQSEHGVAVIVVTHDLTLARAFPRILTVRDGVVSEGLDPRLLTNTPDPGQEP